MPKPFDYDTAKWIYAGPSRRLRKAYAQLAALEDEAAKIRDSNPVPDHAPTSLQAIRCRLRDLEAERYRLYKRIGNLSGSDVSDA